MSLRDDALALHRQAKGKIETTSKVPLRNRDDLSLAYTPGVAEPCKEIHQYPDTVFEYTNKGNTVAVVSDGTAVLGLGDIGPLAGLPVMEGKCVLFKQFAGVDAVPVMLATKDVEEIIQTVKAIAPTYGGINLEDISSPRCFEIERRLKEELDIPVFHDDQHGTAVVVLSAILNAVKCVGKQLADCTAVINGAGSAGIAVAKLILASGVKNLLLVDRHGIITIGDAVNNPAQEAMAQVTNHNGQHGKLADAMRGADIFVGVSTGNVVTREMVASMGPDAIVFAMANPVPEIFPADAKAAGARVVGSGRSDFPNQVNNVLCFPGIFRGALDVRAREINEEMKVAAAHALADLIAPDELREDNVIVDVFDPRVAPCIAKAVAEAARRTGVARC